MHGMEVTNVDGNTRETVSVMRDGDYITITYGTLDSGFAPETVMIPVEMATIVAELLDQLSE